MVCHPAALAATRHASALVTFHSQAALVFPHSFPPASCPVPPPMTHKPAPNLDIESRLPSSQQESESDVTLILEAVRAGETDAQERLWHAVYSELRRVASEKMAREASHATLQPTALVHEVWLRLAGPGKKGTAWENRAHFFSAAGEAMRRILVEQARRRQAAKRGGGWKRAPLAEAGEIFAEEDARVLQVHEALDALAQRNSRQAQIVTLSFFVGLSQKEIAESLEISEKTVQREWVLARSWLYQCIQSRNGGGHPTAE